MSKFIILGDTHAGAKSDNLNFAEYQINYLNSIVDYMKANGIDTIVQLGDIYDRRKYTNHVILDMWNDKFFSRLEKEGIDLHIIVGNHDAALKNTIKVNTPRLFLDNFKNITIYDEPTEIELFGVKCLALPWICTDNYAESIEAAQISRSSLLFGHLELAGFEMYRGQVCHEGMDKLQFSKFEYVFSGHFHTRSESGNIHYVGCPFEFTWADYDDPRGFVVFDTATMEHIFVKNQNPMFYRFEYDDEGKGDDYWKTFDTSSLSGKYLKVNVVNKTDSYQFDRLVDALYLANLEDFKINETLGDLDADDIDDDDIEMEDSVTLFGSYVEASDFSGDKDKLKTFMKSLYVASLEVLE